MPETPGGHRGGGGGGRGRNTHRTGAKNTGGKTSEASDNKNKRGGRGLATHTKKEDVPEPDTKAVPEAEQDPQEKLCQSLKGRLTDCSSQRLRCLHMTLRRLANVDNRISEKDMQQAFQENQVNLTSRLNQRLSDLFGTPQGVDYERLYKCLVTAHNLTDRDSVKARRKRNDLSSRPPMSHEKKDADFLARIESQLIRDQVFFDIDMLRTEFQSADSHRTGKIKAEQMMLICSDKTPLYGALLVNLLKRCDEDKNDTVSWPTLLSFLERGQNNAREKDPELHLLPEKARATAAVNVAPDPLSELSSGTKTRLLSKLIKKNSSRSAGSRASSAMSSAPSVTTSIASRDTSPDPAGQAKTDDATGTDASNKAVSPVPKPEDTKDTTPAKEGGKKRAAEAEKAAEKQQTPPKTPGTPGYKEVPLIEVDKASETDPSGAQDQDGAGGKDTPTTTTTTTTTNTTNTTTTTTPSNTTTANTNPTTTTITTATTTAKPASNTTTTTATTTTTTTTTTATTSAAAEGGGGGKKGEEMEASTPDGGPVVKGVAVTLPRDYKPPDVPVDPPSERLQLDWVYGCRGNDCRRTMQPVGSGELVYFIANICVLLDRRANRQRHYKEHTEDVKCLAVHSNGMLVATGQFASKLRPEHQAHVRVWRSDLLQTVHVLGSGAFSKAVMCVAFMPGKDLLAAVDGASDKHLTVWDLNTQETVADNYFSTDTVCDLEFNPKYPERLVTVGKEHLQWWKVYPDSKELQPFAQPDYESYLRAKYVVCAVHTEKGDLVTGDSNGTVYIWGDGGNKISNFVKHGHEGPVLSVMYYKGYLLSGGRDGAVSAWTWGRNMDNAATVKIPASEGGVRELLVKDGVLILVTTMNSVLSITLPPPSAGGGSGGVCPLAQASLDPIPITQGHFDDLRAVTVIQDSFIGADILTAGSDGVLCKFDSRTHAPVWKLYMKGKEYLCVDCSKTGDLLVLGTRDGRVVVLQVNTENMQVMEVLNKKVTTSGLTCITLSPDQTWMAAGGEDSAIYVFRVSEQPGEEGEGEEDGEEEGGPSSWNVSGILKGHSGEVVSLDWTRQPYTKGGTFLLRSSSSAPQQKFWDVHSNSEVDGSDLSTMPWASSTCILDHLLTGVWGSKQAEKAQVKTVDVNPGNSLVAMGNSMGLLSLYRYPCVKDLVYSHTYQAHQTVRRLRFTPSGRSILTVGGHDSALLQWALV
ncbi:77 kDa echinoderm microtubule-associated protein-like [Babylonia areolata]|uniref:77 kDa echinoderm microtubule-associated protein-like n=1 Tax=Babylonia areolata TaxID=304850 RepID=UPI003FD6048C